MCRVMAIRADSICRLVTYAGSRAWIAYSPKLIAVPPLALPPRSGWCCLRCLTRRGMSMTQLSVFSVAVASAAPGAPGGGGLGAGGLGNGLLGSDVTGGLRDDSLGGVGGRAGRVLGSGAAGLGPTSGGAGGNRATVRRLGALTALLTGGKGLEGLPLGT